LKQAKARGLKDPAAIRREAAFNHLKTREDFQQLLKEMEAKKP
jgi:hypothetical protein